MADDSGWEKLTDPNSGKFFYANHLSRATQWDPPVGFVDVKAEHSVDALTEISNTKKKKSLDLTGGKVGFTTRIDQHMLQPSPSASSSKGDHSCLPPNWEKKHDSKTGRAFYVDHVMKITSWDHPSLSKSDKDSSSFFSESETTALYTNGDDQSTSYDKGMATGFGFIPKEHLPGHPSSSSPHGTRSAAGLDSMSSINRRSGNDPKHSLSATYGGHENLRNSDNYSLGKTGVYSISNTPSRLLVNEDHSSKYYSRTDGDESIDSTLQHTDFTMVHVSDNLRRNCPSCQVVFSLSLRKHHCRLCGDIFCDACSPHKITLPINGIEYQKPVRVCKLCNIDVEKGNYFTMRRYLAPLQLFDPETYEEVENEIKPSTVSAALSALSQDLDSVLQDSSSFSEKVIIEAQILVPSICRHLDLECTQDWAIRALSCLLALGNIIDDNSFAHAVYKQENAKSVLNSILSMLELSGSSRKVLAIQEQASRSLLYLSDTNIISALIAVEDDDADDWNKGSDRLISSPVEYLDIHRALRNVLDHTSSSDSLSLQRWAAASIRNLIEEDQRRACGAVVSALTSGSDILGSKLDYESFTTQLISTGGIMILSSLIGANDGDLRAHATGALSSIIVATRAIETSVAMWKEASGVNEVEKDNSQSDCAIILAIVRGGGCNAIAQLLLSADHCVARMACSFAASLVNPLLIDPRGTALFSYQSSTNFSCAATSLETDEDGLGAYREASLALANNCGVFTALVQLIREPTNGGGVVRPFELKKCAMEVLAAVSLTVAYFDSKLKIAGKALENKSKDISNSVRKAVFEFESENLESVVLSSYFSVPSSISSRDSPELQLREAACLVISCLISFSSLSLKHLHATSILTNLISTAADEKMEASSNLRGEKASRCLAMLEATASILIQGWKELQTNSILEISTKSEKATYHITTDKSFSAINSLDLLIESLDAGVIPIVCAIIESKIEYENEDRACMNIRSKIACCHIIAAILGIGICDLTRIGTSRIYEAIDTNSFHQKSFNTSPGKRHTLSSSLVSLLQSTLMQTQQYLNQKNPVRILPLCSLVEAVLLAIGSICGALLCPFTCQIDNSSENCEEEKIGIALSRKPAKDDYTPHRQEACTLVCSVLVNNSVLASALVGAFGEGSVLPALRLGLTLIQNGPLNVHLKLASSGFLVPINDMLRNGLISGNRFIFSASLIIIRFCGPHVTASSCANGDIKALQQSIQTLTNVLSIEELDIVHDQSSTLVGLKRECLFTLDALSTNSSLWNVITMESVPHISQYLLQNSNWNDKNDLLCATLSACLRIIQRVISLPSHIASIARAGLGVSLSKIIYGRNHSDERANILSHEVQLIALELLHKLSFHEIARHGHRTADSFVHCGAVDAACFSLAKNVVVHSDDRHDPGKHSITKAGLEILQYILMDITNPDCPLYKESTVFVNAIVLETDFIRSLCATSMLFKNETTGHEAEVINHTHVNDINEDDALFLTPCYGPPLILYKGSCFKFSSPLYSTISTFFLIASLCHEKIEGKAFWDTVLLKNSSKLADKYTSESISFAITGFCAVFLSILQDENKGICVPKIPSEMEYFHTITLPNVRKHLLDGLLSNLKQILLLSKTDKIITFLQQFSLPQTCLALLRDNRLMDTAFQVLEIIFSEFSDTEYCKQISLLMISDKNSMTSLLDLLALDPIETPYDRIKSFAVQVLGTSGRLDILGFAVQQFDLRSTAIASLSTAFLSEENRIDDEIEGIWSVCTLLLYGLLGILGGISNKNEVSESAKECDSFDKKKLVISPTEAKLLASTLGKKLSQMVLENFLRQTDIQHFKSEKKLDIDDAVTESVAVNLLCALASSKEALPYLCANGGLEALALVASAGELRAISALNEVVQDDPEAILAVDGHISIMNVLTDEQMKPSKVVLVECMKFLASFCSETKSCRTVISESEYCHACITFTSDALSQLSSVLCDEISDDEKIASHKELNDDCHSNSLSCTLEIEGISFLTSLLHIRISREMMVSNQKLMRSIISLSASKILSLQYWAVNYLADFARYATNECVEGSLSINYLASVFLSLIITPSNALLRSSTISHKKFIRFDLNSDRDSFNMHLILASICSGIDCMLHHIPEKALSSITTALLPHLNKILDDKNKISSKSKTSRLFQNESLYDGLLAFNISSMFIRFLGSKENINILIEVDVVSVIIKLILINQQSIIVKQNVKEEEIFFSNINYWKCAFTQCLQCFSLIVIQPFPLHDELNTWEELIFNLEGKTIETSSNDFSLILKKVVSDNTDVTQSVLARQIINRMF